MPGCYFVSPLQVPCSCCNPLPDGFVTFQRREGIAAASAAAYAAALIIGIGVLWAGALFSASGFVLLSGAASLAASAAGSRWGMRASFEGPCAVVEVAHEAMLAFRKMVGRLCCPELR